MWLYQGYKKAGFLVAILLSLAVFFAPKAQAATITTFGSYENAFTEFADPSCGRSKVTFVTSPAREGKYAGRFEGPNECYESYSKPGNYSRIHMLKFPSGTGVGMDSGSAPFWWTYSLYIPSGYESQSLNAGPEIHQPNTTDLCTSGPAPFNMQASGGSWRIVIRGSSGCAKDNFQSTSFGQTTYSDCNSSNRLCRAWTNGISPVIQPGQWYDFLVGFNMKTDSSGWVEAWVNGPGTGGRSVQIVPRTNLPTAFTYPGQYPMNSLYYSGSTSSRVLLYDGGAFSNDFNELVAWQNAFTCSWNGGSCLPPAPSPGPTPPPAPTPAPTPTPTNPNKPYFKVAGGDIYTGGGFNTGATSCSSSASSYQAPTFGPLQNQYKGGILAFANTRHGSSSDFGAFAMGLIQGNASSSYGFYTGQTSGTNSLSFSNTNTGISSDYWGGYLAGATQQIHCIPDYFATKQSTTTPPTSLGSSFNVGTLASGQYKAPSGQVVDITAGAAANMAAGKSVTVFVDGDVYISNNITYDGSYTADNVPKLAIVVKGNIFVAPGVTQLVGVYIAQPSSDGSNGSFWTCHDNSVGIPANFGYWVAANCGSKLSIYGAVVAKQANLLRLKGDLSVAVDNEISSSSNVAEAFNYIPAMVVGGPFFNPPLKQDPAINSLISLPPVF